MDRIKLDEINPDLVTKLVRRTPQTQLGLRLVNRLD